MCFKQYCGFGTKIFNMKHKYDPFFDNIMRKAPDLLGVGVHKCSQKGPQNRDWWKSYLW